MEPISSQTPSSFASLEKCGRPGCSSWVNDFASASSRLGSMMLVFSGVKMNLAPPAAAARIKAAAVSRLGPVSGPAVICTQANFTAASSTQRTPKIAVALLRGRLRQHGGETPGAVKRI